MDITKLQQALEEIRRHLAAGDRDAAIALYRATLGVDRQAAEQAIEQMVAGKPVAITPSVEIKADDVGRHAGQILAAVSGGGLAGTVLRFASIDFAKSAGEGNARTMHMALPTMRLPGNDQSDATPPTDAAARPPAPAPDDRLGHVGVSDRRHGPTVQRSRGLGIFGLSVVLLVLAAAAAVAVILLRRG